jgi:exodeoxyribonuclease VII large subunit
MTANFFEFQQQLVRAGRAASAQPPKAADEKPLTVSELTMKITRVISSALPPRVLVRGELSGKVNRNHSSGHLYFTLKDADACIDCVMFRAEAAALKFQPLPGMELTADGRVGVYGARGRYQLYVNQLRPLGKGALELAFQQMRAKLEAEGLFGAERKKPIPNYPSHIVLITSPEAAALQDMLKVLRRFAWLHVMLYAVPVQGDGAAERIASAIRHVNARIAEVGAADVILLARGGGSLEDLWSFNEEIVARAIAASHIPVVTGIGHEVDVSIADLVADHHAHTPTEAAQVITAHWRGAGDHLNRSADRLRRSLRAMVGDATQRLRGIERHETFRRPLDRSCTLRQLLDERQRGMIVAGERLLRHASDRLRDAALRIERFLPAFLLRERDQLDAKQRHLDAAMASGMRSAHQRLARVATLLQDGHPKYRLKLEEQRLRVDAERLRRGLAQSLQLRTQQVEALSRQLEAVSPPAVLTRGYTMTLRKKDGQPIRTAAQLKSGDRILTRFADGQVESTVDDSKQLSLFE